METKKPNGFLTKINATTFFIRAENTDKNVLAVISFKENLPTKDYWPPPQVWQLLVKWF